MVQELFTQLAGLERLARDPYSTGHSSAFLPSTRNAHIVCSSYLAAKARGEPARSSPVTLTG